MESSHAAEIREVAHQQILEAAFTRFGHYGYNKTTMAEIAEDSGMSAANLYRYFENKQDIAAACASRCMCQRIDLLRDAVRQPKLSAGERLHNYVMTMLIDCHETFSNETKINKVVAFITNERPDLVHQKIEAQHALIAEILAHGNQSGEFDIKDIITTAQSIYTAVAVFDVPLFMSLYPLEEYKQKARDVVTLLLDGLTFGILALRTQEELVQKERLAVLEQLIATVSHELRNPLGTIRSSLYTIENYTSTHDVDIDKQIKRIERNIFRCDNIIDELLDYTRIRDLTLQSTDIDAWLTSELDEYTFPDTVKVTRKLKSNAIINIEHDRFRRCIINILNNACDAMRENTESSIQHIAIDTNIVDHRLTICITDSGPEIQSNEINKIFEPLFSTKTYGVGLGLSIVKQILGLHGGNIEITSKPGQGTTAQLWLPLKSN